MSEEIRNPSRIVPASMLTSILLNGVLGFGMLVGVLFCTGDLNEALSTKTGYPFMEIFLQGTRSSRGSAAMISIIIVLGVCATIAVLASSSRLTWSNHEPASPSSPSRQQQQSPSSSPSLASAHPWPSMMSSPSQSPACSSPT
ncbi:MAG: hypothetical protein Q9218_007771 [Villophora microphyllina]